MSPKNQRGVVLYISLMIMTILLAIALNLGVIFIGQIEVMRRMGNSVIAFHAANTGIERILVDRESPSSISETFLPNGASYEVIVVVGETEGCLAANFCIRSIGAYRGTRRAIEIKY